MSIFLASTYFGVIGYMLSRYYIDINPTLYFLFSLSIGIGFVFFFMTILYEIATHTIKISKNDSRREFFQKMIDYSVVAGASSYATYGIVEGTKIPTIIDVDIKLNGLDKEYTIAQLSDVHIGGLVDKEFVKNIVKKINTLSSDIVVITGDLIDTNISIVKDAVDELKNISSKYGTYFILGNHEYFHGPEEIMSYLESIGIHVLKNSSKTINSSFNLIGVYDIFGNRAGKLKPSLDDAIKDIDHTLPNILLAHQPKYLKEIDISNISLALCGHTHGGQIFPFSLLVKLQQPYLKGLYKEKDTYIYVNKGTGFWGPPMRIGASAEITNIKISPI
jgi:predicted MPP superfamily phosphohydrolase